MPCLKHVQVVNTAEFMANRLNFILLQNIPENTSATLPEKSEASSAIRVCCFIFKYHVFSEILSAFYTGLCSGDLELFFHTFKQTTHTHTHKAYFFVHCMNSAYLPCFSLVLSKCVTSFNPAGHEIHFSLQCLLKFNFSQIIFQMAVSLELSN